MALTRDEDVQAKTLEELKEVRKDQTVDFYRMLALDFEEITGGKKSVKLESLFENDVEHTRPEFFNNNINFWEIHKQLFNAYEEEIKEACEGYVKRAEKLPKEQWRRKVRLLQKALKLTER